MKLLVLSLLMYFIWFGAFCQSKQTTNLTALENKWDAYKSRKDRQIARKAKRVEKQVLPGSDRKKLREAKRSYQHGKNFPPHSYTISFGKDGKIEKGTVLISAFPKDSTLILDPGKIKAPASAFVKSITALAGNITSLVSSTSVPNCVCKPFPATTIAALTKLANSLTDITQSQVLTYDATDSYLPVSLTSASPTVMVNDKPLTSSFSLTFSGGNKPEEYQLILPEYDNQIVAKHLEKTAEFYRGISPGSQLVLDSLRTLYKQHTIGIDALLMRDSLNVSVCTSCSVGLSFQIGIIDLLTPLYPFIQKTTALRNKVLCDNQDWINRWLWYTGGNIRLNPFIINDPAPLIRQVDQQIQLVEKRLVVLQAYTDCCVDQKMEYELAKVRADTLTNQLNELKSRKEDLTGKVKIYAAWLTKIAVKSKVLYSGVLPGSTAKSILWQHQYDATDEFNSITPTTELPDILAEDDKVVVLIHNVRAGDSISLTATEEVFTPKTKLELGLEPFSDALAAAFKVVTPIGKITSVIAGLSPKVKEIFNETKSAMILTDSKIETVSQLRSSIGERLMSSQDLNEELTSLGIDPNTITYANKSNLPGILLKLQGSTASEQLKDAISGFIFANKAEFVERVFHGIGVQDVAAYTELITEYKISKKQLAWLLSQTQPILSVDSKDDKEPAFRTMVNYPEKKLDLMVSKKVTYNLLLNARKEPEVKKSYTKYTLARWLPTVGIAYIPGNRTGSVFNDTTGTFKSGDDFDNFEALVGVKYYFKKTNPARDRDTRKLIERKFGVGANVMRGNAFWNTMFLTGGFGVRHKLLRNYYLGVGGDITPGLSWQAGFNFIFQKRYQLENGQIKNEYERPKGYPYIGLSIDPGVVTNLINIFK